MKLSELKSNIKSDELSNSLIIFTCAYDTFFAEQYTAAIANMRNYDIKYYKSLQDIMEMRASTFAGLSVTNELSVVRVDTFDEDFEFYDEFYDCIVICEKIDKKIKPKIDEWFIVDVPQVQDWQLTYYVNSYCSGLSAKAVNWLVEHTKNCPSSADRTYQRIPNIFKLTNILDMLRVFDENEREEALIKIINDTRGDLSELPFFDVVNYIVAKDFTNINKFFMAQAYCDVDPIPLTNTLLAKFKELLLITYGGCTAEELGINPKKVWFIKKEAANWSAKELRLCITFLSDLDYRLKSGRFEINNESATSYIICRLFSYIGQYGTV